MPGRCGCSPATAPPADEVYGNAGDFRTGLEDLGIGYVLAVSCSTTINVGPARIRADALARALDDECWQIRSAGPGSKGQRLYQWAYLHLDEPPRAAGSVTCVDAVDEMLASSPTS